MRVCNRVAACLRLSSVYYELLAYLPSYISKTASHQGPGHRTHGLKGLTSRALQGEVELPPGENKENSVGKDIEAVDRVFDVELPDSPEEFPYSHVHGMERNPERPSRTENALHLRERYRNVHVGRCNARDDRVKARVAERKLFGAATYKRAAPSRHSPFQGLKTNIESAGKPANSLLGDGVAAAEIESTRSLAGHDLS